MNQIQQKPIAKLGDYVGSDELKKLESAAKKPELVTKSQIEKKKRNNEDIMVEPFYLKKLHEAIGKWPPIAKELGCSDQNLSGCVKAGKIRKCYEVAAKGIWLERYEPKPAAQPLVAPPRALSVLVKCPLDRVRELEAFAQGIGANAWALPE